MDRKTTNTTISTVLQFEKCLQFNVAHRREAIGYVFRLSVPPHYFLSMDRARSVLEAAGVVDAFRIDHEDLSIQEARLGVKNGFSILDVQSMGDCFFESFALATTNTNVRLDIRAVRDMIANEYIEHPEYFNSTMQDIARVSEMQFEMHEETADEHIDELLDGPDRKMMNATGRTLQRVMQGMVGETQRDIVFATFRAPEVVELDGDDGDDEGDVTDLTGGGKRGPSYAARSRPKVSIVPSYGYRNYAYANGIIRRGAEPWLRSLLIRGACCLPTSWGSETEANILARQMQCCIVIFTGGCKMPQLYYPHTREGDVIAPHSKMPFVILFQTSAPKAMENDGHFMVVLFRNRSAFLWHQLPRTVRMTFAYLVSSNHVVKFFMEKSHGELRESTLPS